MRHQPQEIALQVAVPGPDASRTQDERAIARHEVFLPARRHGARNPQLSDNSSNTDDLVRTDDDSYAYNAL